MTLLCIVDKKSSVLIRAVAVNLATFHPASTSSREFILTEQQIFKHNGARMSKQVIPHAVTIAEKMFSAQFSPWNQLQDSQLQWQLGIRQHQR